jgi:hypothetical protein
MTDQPFTLPLTEDEARELAKYIDKHGFHFGEEEMIGAIRSRLPKPASTDDAPRS